MSQPLILASASTSRRAMLDAAGIAHEACVPDLDEDRIKAQLRADGADPVRLAMMLARAKAMSVAGADALVLGSDQTLALADGQMIDKARDRDDAAAILRRLSGQRHHLHSAAVIARAGESIWHVCQSVTMDVRPLSDAFIDAYLDAQWDNVRWCVGCYQVEGAGVQLFHAIDGCQFAVRGLPLLPLLDFLRDAGVVAT